MSLLLRVVCGACMALCSACSAVEAPFVSQHAIITPDSRPETLIEALQNWPDWDNDDRRNLVMTGRDATMPGGVSPRPTAQSGWTEKEAERRIQAALVKLATGTTIQLRPSHSPLPERGVSHYVYNPVLVDGLAFIEADRPWTGACTYVFEWRSAWVPVATLLGQVF